MAIDLTKGLSGGLDEKDALIRLKENGFNELPSAKKRNLLSIAFDVAMEPMFILLVACGTIYLFIGDVEEALMLLGFVFIVIGITLYQENKTERALEALKDLSSPRAVVIRNGEKKKIPSKEVVRDDIIILSEGDRVPADAIILSGTNLMVDESILTGESAPVRKCDADEMAEMVRPGGEDLPFVYSGTLVVSGTATALVKATGLYTEIGKIGRSLQKIETEKNLLQKETGQIVKTLAIAGIVLCTLVVLLYGLRSGNWLIGLLAGITLAMSILPEEFPVVLTIFLALGAWRMSHKKVLMRKQHAIHSLGSATVLCVDKTGTITENSMSLKTICSKGKTHTINSKNHLPEDFHTLIEFGRLASRKDPFDPMETALKEISHNSLNGTEHLHPNWQFVQEYPLSKQLLAVSNVWKAKENEEYLIAAKGAPEAIGELCHLKEDEMNDLMKNVGEMADNGLRVLGVARSSMKKMPLPKSQHDFEFEFLGLLGFEDPVRENAKDAIEECRQAGIRVVMITGDYAGTAKNIAGKIGLLSPGGIITGPELTEMGDDVLKEKIKNVNIFARVIPEQKLRLVNALKEMGEVVAMTGDGVNDAPALKSAHIGVAMGGRGTDVAKEASSVVILDDNFSSIVGGVREGRHIFDNIRKAMIYTLAVHIPIAGITLLAVLLGWPLILLPVHIVFLELIINPTCSIVFERQSEESNIMKRPPRSTKERIFDRKNTAFSLLQGTGILALVALVFWWAISNQQNEPTTRALAFSVLIVSNLALILSNRSWNSALSTLASKNTAFWAVVFGALTFLAATLYIPLLREIFSFGSLAPSDFLIIGASAAVILAWSEILKKLIMRGR